MFYIYSQYVLLDIRVSINRLPLLNTISYVHFCYLQMRKFNENGLKFELNKIMTC